MARRNDEPFDCSVQSVIQCDLHNDRVFYRITCGFSRVPEAALRVGYLRYSFTSPVLWYHHRQVLCSLLRQTVVCFLLEACSVIPVRAKLDTLMSLYGVGHFSDNDIVHNSIISSGRGLENKHQSLSWQHYNIRLRDYHLPPRVGNNLDAARFRHK